MNVLSFFVDKLFSFGLMCYMQVCLGPSKKLTNWRDWQTLNVFCVVISSHGVSVSSCLSQITATKNKTQFNNVTKLSLQQRSFTMTSQSDCQDKSTLQTRGMDHSLVMHPLINRSRHANEYWSSHPPCRHPVMIAASRFSPMTVMYRWND